MTKTKETFKVGDILLYVPSREYVRSRDRVVTFREVTITKVGRKWLETTGYGRLRFDRETLRADGGEYSSPGRAYRSPEEYQLEQDIHAEWDAIYALVESQPYTPRACFPHGLAHLKSIRKDIEMLVKAK